MSEKKTYTAPEIRPLGSVTDLTRTGRTHPGADMKGGSAASKGR